MGEAIVFAVIGLFVVSIIYAGYRVLGLRESDANELAKRSLEDAMHIKARQFGAKG